MKKLEFNITPSGNKENIKMVFEIYKRNPSPQNAVLIINYIVSYYLSIYNIENMKLSYEKIRMLGAHEKQHIFINQNLIKKAKKVEGLPELIDVTLHELCHEILQRRNEEIIKSRIINVKYLPEFIHGQMQNLFKDVFNNDLELSIYASIYYYSKNENELNARKFAYKQTLNILNEYMKGAFNIKSFEEKENDRKRKLLSDMEYISYIHIFENCIIKYQKNLIENGLNNLSQEKIINLINSFSLVCSQDIKNMLIKELINCQNLSIVKLVLKTPIIEIDKQDKIYLINAYGKDNLTSIFFKTKEYEKEV